MSNKDIDKILAAESEQLLEGTLLGETGNDARLAKWLCESRRHVRHYLNAIALERELQFLDPHRRWDITAPEETRENVVAIGENQSAAPRYSSQARWSIPPRPLRAAAPILLAALIVLLGALLIPHQASGWRDFSTTVGEQRAVALIDGSVVHLNTGSRLRVRYFETGRDIRLISGEALFKVQHDATRPFRVHTSDAVIQAVGTEFNVNTREESTTVSVLEGRVRVVSEAFDATNSNTKSVAPAADDPSRVSTSSVDAINLGAGQRARITRAGAISTESTSDVAHWATWRQRRLVFQATPLVKMVTEFNRYNRTPRFVLHDTEVANRPYSGIFDADDPKSLVELLQHEPGLYLERRGEEIVIKARSNTEMPVMAVNP